MRRSPCRSTPTLIVRPALPLRQETRYAVILTDRVQDTQGRAVVPPGPGINHPAQNGELSPVLGHLPPGVAVENIDRKSTRLNSSHGSISYAVFCLKKKKKK